MKEPFSFDQFFAPPRDLTPTITAFARALLPMEPKPEQWFVDEITLATIRDESKSIRMSHDSHEIVMICGVRIVEFDQPT